MSGDFLITIISDLRQEGANEETGEIPRGVKTRISDVLKIDLHCVTRAWSKLLTDKNAVLNLNGDLKPNCGRKKKIKNRRRSVHSVFKKESFDVASDHSGNWLHILIRRFRYKP